MDIRQEVVTYAKMSYNKGLTSGTAGNVSVRKDSVMYITPSALPYNQMKKKDILKVDIKSGNILSGNRKPSTETSMHRYIYLENQAIGAIVHTHSTYATMFACAHVPIPPVHYLIADIGKEVRIAPYARYGTKKLAKYVVETLGDDKGILLANHGVVTIGDSLSEAYRRAETIEEVAKLAFGCYTLNSIKPLTTQDLEETLEGFKTYISG